MNIQSSYVHSLPQERSRKLLSSLENQTELTKERDACGVGFIADLHNQPKHKLVMQALEALIFMEHRGACSADRDSGDGAGVLTSIPWKIFDSWLEKNNISYDKSKIGIAMIFLPKDIKGANEAKAIVEWKFKENQFNILGWREVPVVEEVLGSLALENKPLIEQVIVESQEHSEDSLERVLYLTRKKIEKSIADTLGSWADEFYICSCSSKIIVYKGMVRSAVLGQFYQDLHHPNYESSFVIYHRRFSTNTMPKWPLAQPMRLLGHNGEINTLLGNLNWMTSREASLNHPFWGENIQDLKPITNPTRSDSANLDSTLELLSYSGRSSPESLMILIPEAYQNHSELINYPNILDFYEYYSGLQEAWDGPALIVFGDGRTVGATLDRNGLRPARYCVTKEDLVIVSSEGGIVDIEPEKIVNKGRLGPGQMIAVDLENQELLYNLELKQKIASKLPYGKWIQQNRHILEEQSFLTYTKYSSEEILKLQTSFGYTAEDVELVIENMASQAKEPTFCMGDDIPLAVLSGKPHLLYDYFKQRFAQVTNPAIDPLRESLVMSLCIQLGKKGNLLTPEPEASRLIKLNSPIINENELKAIENSSFHVSSLTSLFDLNKGPEGLHLRLEELCQKAEEKAIEGCEILIISDRVPQLSSNNPYIPPLLAIGTIHHYLIEKGVRQNISLIIDTAQCWSTHHFACLIGYGANAVCPYLALETARQWWADSKTQTLMEKGRIANCTLVEAQDNYRRAVEAGLLKILSKMGISLLSSYNGAQIFEILGLGNEVTNLAFCGTVSRVGGLNLKEIAQETIDFYSSAFSELTRKKLENCGFVQYRPGGEYHINNPEMSKALHKAVRGYNPQHYESYKKLLLNRPPTTLRDLLDIKSEKTPINIEEVESTLEITKRFCTGGMSLGALSRETHETLAIAMNRIHGKSNSGEGGEDPLRFTVLNDVDDTGHSESLPHLKGLKNGDTANSAIKQIASGRFGVTPEYLVNASQLEIKIAQGAKPGEGGQLPGKKVSPYIAKLRACKPGVPLISPPPHHDIYSIEDLAQLIFDLHQINPKAKVSVKLVAEIGIGTISAGVAKANADIIQISGHDGGTGASPLSSIKHAGIPWELGLYEVHKVLLENQLRDRIVLRTDGGLRTGLDVVMAALLGGEEYGFGTVAMIASGCIMARICHTNSCPVGVATQREELRARYPGIPEAVVNYFIFVAEEIRSLLASLGYKSLNEIIGRTDLLQLQENVNLNKTDSLDIGILLDMPNSTKSRDWLNHEEVHSNGPILDDELLNEPEIKSAIQAETRVEKHIKIVNTNRTVGARLAGNIAKLHGNFGFRGNILLNFYGTAGQSFGAFNIQGVTLRLIGEANDYVGKGMNGGEIIIVPPSEAQFDPSEQVILGNTCLYGATGGSLFAKGQAGERFAVRNSMATSVVEGVGDHACEYMTGGTVVVLGKAGQNIAAGMTGGIAYFLDEDEAFKEKINTEIVKIQRIVTTLANNRLKKLLMQHAEKTGSLKAQHILQDWESCLQKFWQVVPPSEANTTETNPSIEIPVDSVAN
uniref:Ferredoxin-dependent glutamate synthase n=1 Tax=Sciadococcus taiwanensis TaxID=3028030 RepID=A0A9Y1I226_9RHOD|nr:glutamate synthase [Sciadococcus taiwanensis]